jgi:hypothetical protein
MRVCGASVLMARRATHCEPSAPLHQHPLHFRCTAAARCTIIAAGAGLALRHVLHPGQLPLAALLLLEVEPQQEPELQPEAGRLLYDLRPLVPADAAADELDHGFE